MMVIGYFYGITSETTLSMACDASVHLILEIRMFLVSKYQNTILSNTALTQMPI